MAVWLGPREGKCDLVLAEECRPLYSADYCGSFMERQTSACFATLTPVSSAVQFMLHHPQRPEDGALDLGQHQGAFLLVGCFGSAGCHPAGAVVAEGLCAKIFGVSFVRLHYFGRRA